MIAKPTLPITQTREKMGENVGNQHFIIFREQMFSVWASLKILLPLPDSSILHSVSEFF